MEETAAFSTEAVGGSPVVAFTPVILRLFGTRELEILLIICSSKEESEWGSGVDGDTREYGSLVFSNHFNRRFVIVIEDPQLVLHILVVDPLNQLDPSELGEDGMQCRLGCCP